MIAAASAVIEAGPDGAPRYLSLRSAPPLLLRPTPDALYLVGGAGGPVGGDDVRLRLALGPKARLTVRSAAATVARPGPEPTEWSRFSVTADLGAGAALAWLVEPGVASAGCRHHVDVEIRIVAGCTLIWRDELVLGRHGERPGSWSTSLRADLDGRALLRQRLDVGPHAPGWDGPAIVGNARAVGSVLMVQPDVGVGLSLGPHQRSDLGRLSVMPLAGPGVLVSALASTAGGLRQILERHAGGHRT